MDAASYGDVIFVDRGAYKHFGIYSGKNKVIHYTKENNGVCDGIIRETSLSDFLDGDKAYCVYKIEDASPLMNLLDDIFGNRNKLLGDIFSAIVDDVTLHSPEETVKRARSCIGQGEYDIVTNNCEHFAIWCKTGVKRSEQVEEVLDSLTEAIKKMFVT